MSTVVDITGLSPAAVLAALYNNARINPTAPAAAKGLTVDQAQQRLTIHTGFDSLQGRNLGLLWFDSRTTRVEVSLYDRHNGTGLAERVIAHLRATGSVARIA